MPNFFFYAHPDLKAVWQPYRTSLNIMVSPTFCEDVLSDIAQSDSISFIRMTDYFLQNQDEGPFHLLPFDRHCNGNGYRVQAEVIAKEITNIEKLQQ